jgi:hypothetical protein
MGAVQLFGQNSALHRACQNRNVHRGTGVKHSMNGLNEAPGTECIKQKHGYAEGVQIFGADDIFLKTLEQLFQKKCHRLLAPNIGAPSHAISYVRRRSWTGRWQRSGNRLAYHQAAMTC